MKGKTGAIIGVILAVVVILGVINYQKKDTDSANLYIGITDATADISGVTDVDMEVRKIEVYSVANGWVTASSDTKTYSLLALKASGETKLYVKGKVEAGSYDKVRVTLGDTTVRTKANGDVKAVMPTSYVVVDSNINLESEGSAYIRLDFLADKSLHVASGGEYVFAPVVNVDYGSEATVTVTGDVMVVGDGSTTGNASVGVDLEGKSRPNFQLLTGKSLIVKSSTDTEVTFMLGGQLYTSKKEVEADASATTDSKVDIKIPNSIEVDGALAPKSEIDVKSPAVNTESKTNGGIKIGQ